MKNLKYIAVFLLIISSSLTFKVLAQSSLTQGVLAPIGPYAGGTLITIPYSMEFTMLTGSVAELNIAYPSTLFDFVSSDLTSSGIWTLINATSGNLTYQTAAFTSADNNYTSATDFTVTFRVKSASCNLLSDSIVATLTVGSNTTPVQISTPISILNSGTGVSATMNLIQGDECSIAMYEINSFGLDTSSSNSTFSLTLPVGATLQGVFNTIGNPVFFTSSGSTYSWLRSGIANELSQKHYVIIAFDQSVLCQNSSPNQLGLVFNSHNVCNPNTVITSTTNHLFSACCNQPPNTMNGVVLRKSLIKYPLLYFPSPNNCKTHDYIIKVDNLTANNLTDFYLNDFLNDIIPSFSGEIEVTQITAAFNSIIPGASFSLNSTLGSSSMGTTLSSFNPNQILFNAGPYLDSNFNLTGTSAFPKYSSLTVKITHRLGVDPLSTPYNNKAQLDFKVGTTPYSGTVNLQSVKDNFEPSIIIEKKVKNITDSGPYSSSVSASPSDNLQFEIKIKNYGMMAVSNVNLTDLITNLPSNFNNPTSFLVTGTGYTPVQLAAIQSGSISSSGFTRNFTINAAPCNGYTELVLTYKASVKPNITCNSIYTNKATINYNFNSNPYTKSSTATVNIDLFKNISYKLEASCKSEQGPWVIGAINGIPGQPIWFKASVKNNNNYAVSDLKMMVQLPSLPSLTSNHGSINLVSSAPSLPIGTNLHPELGSVVSNINSMSITNTAMSGWLNGSGILPTNIPTANVAIYKVIPSLNSQSETTIIYKVMVPVNTFGTQYSTALGVSKSSNSACPIVKNTSLNLTVASSNNCGSISGCDLILFDSKVERDLSNLMKFNITISNMLNSYTGFNVDNFDIVVHQPYSDILTPSPYTNLMIGYKLDAISSGIPLYTFPLGTPVVGGRRYHKVNSSVPTLNFGTVNFDLISTNLPPFYNKLTFPINITFRDKSDPCFICERTINLNYTPPAWTPWNQLIQKDMLESETDPVNLSLNAARQRLQKSPAGPKIEQWYKDLKEHNGIGKMLLNHPSDVIELFKIARKMIEKGGVFEQKDYDLIEKNMRLLDGVWKAPAGLIDDSLRRLKSLIGQKWSMSIFDRWGNF